MLPVEAPRPRPSSPPPPKPTALGRKFSPAEVAILETFVVPRYLAKFGEAVLSMMLLGDTAKIAHFGCRTGYPDRELLQKSDGSSITGVDASLAAVELARNKAAILGDVSLGYRVASSYPTELESDAFSHAMSLHPVGTERERLDLFREMARVLYSGGQALVSLPLRGSFKRSAAPSPESALKSVPEVFERATEIAT